MSSSSQDSTEAFITLFLQNERRLWHYILALVPTEQDAEDVLQETAVVLWRKRQEFRPGSDFAAWARAVARNKVLEWRRRVPSSPALDEDVLEQLAWEAECRATAFDERQSAMQECMQRLPTADAELIRQRYSEGLSGLELAQRLKRPVNSIYQSLGRIRRVLLDCITRKLARS
jgi:RNA polymerase sigma-70 factor (ECF subfamily)